MSVLGKLQELAANEPWAVAASVAVVAGTAAYMQSPHYKLCHIPTVGASSWPLLSYIGARRYIGHAMSAYQVSSTCALSALSVNDTASQEGYERASIHHRRVREEINLSCSTPDACSRWLR
jgi:hypothetical protein